MSSSNLSSNISSLLNSSFMKNLAKQRDLVIILGVVGVVLIMIIPIPTFLMDIMLTLSLCIGLFILLISMYTKEALEFSVFPSLLLTVTLFRLSLNIATTRLILSQADAGYVVDVFGTFVTKGNMVVGAIIFLILVIIQFLVITKGAGRIAEVAARFTLDAMPGKQMAIDADLNAGLINEEQARERRSKISREADFYGAMDGASKFVRGDAIAGILITIINVIGGFIIGIAQLGMDWATSLETYTVLTIGDGLISQIPALMISTGSGILVSRAASQTDLGNEITAQLFSRPKVMAVVGSLMLILMFIPGLPKVPFLLIGIGGLVAAYLTNKRLINEKKAAEAPIAAAQNKTKEEKAEDYLHVDPMELEIGYGLIPLVDVKQGGDLLDRITMIRRQLAAELGIIIPPIRIRDNIQLKPNEYRIKIRTIVTGKGELMNGAYLAMDPGSVTKKIRGIPTVEPAFNLPALWITESQKEDAEMAGYTVVELPAVLATHLTEIIKRHAFEILTRQDVRNLLDNLKENNGTVVDELIPSILSVGDVHKVLQNLLRERVSIRDLLLILETLANVGTRSKNHEILTEYVRNALAPQICEVFKNDDNIIPVITIDPNLEAKLEGAVQETESGFRLAISPGDVARIIDSTGEIIESVKVMGEIPIVLCSPTIRSQFKKLTENNYNDLVVLSYNEIIPGIEIRSLAMIGIS
jgi:flagellar biosynthesis protein FlhA